jgi:hypothetical protein
MNQHLIGLELFQEWILVIKSTRTPDKQNIELFQSTEINLLGFRTTRLVVPNEPLLSYKWNFLVRLFDSKAICIFLILATIALVLFALIFDEFGLFFMDFVPIDLFIL